MKYEQLAKDIIRNIGGRENVHTVWHCITRLRFDLKDEKKADTEAIKQLDGVLDVIQTNEQYQVVIGTHVEEVYNDLIAVGGLKKKDNHVGTEFESKEKGSQRKGLASFIDLLMAIFQPVLGLLAASGMIKALLALLTVAGLLVKTDGTYTILSAAGDALFYFFPIILGWSAAKRFGLKEPIGMALGGVLVYPALSVAPGTEPLFTIFQGTLFEQPIYTTFLNIPVIMPKYSTTVIPIIVIVFLASKLSAWLSKVLPSMMRTFFVPFFTILIIAPLSLLIIGPIAVALQDLIGAGVTGLIGLSPALAGLILGAVWSILVMFGLHWGVIPLFALNVSNYGYDVVNPLIFAGAFASLGAALGVIFVTKDSQEKSNLLIPAAISTFFGVNEPTLYGILVPRKRLMGLTFLSAGVGGAIAGFSGAKLWSFGASGPLGFPNFINPDGIDAGFIGLMVGAVVAFVLAFIAGTIFGKEKDAQ
ncbi:TPA: PTS transporter subunit EIIC [Streptococcus suis]